MLNQGSGEGSGFSFVAGFASRDHKAFRWGVWSFHDRFYGKNSGAFRCSKVVPGWCKSDQNT
jgi:hypothetical protein